jgi:hypothetical protein
MAVLCNHLNDTVWQNRVHVLNCLQWQAEHRGWCRRKFAVAVPHAGLLPPSKRLPELFQLCKSGV